MGLGWQPARAGLGVLWVVLALLMLAHPAAAADAGTDERPPPGMKAKVYQLKNRSVDDLIDALRPLMSDTRGSMIRKSDELRTITARDFPENLAAIDQALKRLDVPTPPQPDVEVQIRVLIASPAAGPNQIPGDLDGVVKQLGTALSYKSYHQVAAVTQRLRAGANTSGKGELALAPPAAEEKTSGHFHYAVEKVAPPAPGAGGVITLRRFKLSLEGGQVGEAEVSTGLTLREGEKVVVGTGSLKNRAMVVVVSARQLR
jgi:hypothetical protein